MPSGYIVAGRGDLDALFAARSSTKRADVGMQVAGVDISNRYETIGAQSPIAATGYKSAGVDLANLFRKPATATAGVSPSSFFNANPAASWVSTDSATCTVTGNIGAPTYQWVRISGSTKVSFGNGTAATTNFIATGLTQFESAIAEFKCTVTVDSTTFDAVGTCTVTLYRP